MAVAVGTVPALGFALAEAYGWRGAYEVFGIGIWVLLIPLVVLVFRDRLKIWDRNWMGMINRGEGDSER